MKRGWLALELIVVSVGPLAGCAERRADAAVVSYSRDIKPGMTRKIVEDELRANKIQFGQMCCVEGGHKRSLDDVSDAASGPDKRPTVHVNFKFPITRTSRSCPKSMGRPEGARSP